MIPDRMSLDRITNVMATAVILSADGCKREDKEKTDEERVGRGSGTPSDVVPGDPQFNWMFDAFGDELSSLAFTLLIPPKTHPSSNQNRRQCL